MAELVFYTNPMSRFEKYWERVNDRDAYRRATELDNALMPKQT